MDSSQLNPVLAPYGLFIGTTAVGKGLFVKKYIEAGEYILQNETPLVCWPVYTTPDSQFCEVCLKPGNFDTGVCSDECNIIATDSELGVMNLFGGFIKQARDLDGGNPNGSPITTESLVRSYAKVLSSTLLTLSCLPTETEPSTRLQAALGRSVSTFDQFCRPYSSDIELYSQDLDFEKLRDIVRGLCNKVTERLEEGGYPTDMFKTWSENILLEDNISTLIGQICLNFKRFALADGQFIGAGIYQVASSINHSCSPNAEIICIDNNSNVYIKALTNISPFSEVTISYVNYNDSVLDRNILLLGFYKFICNCPKCVEEGVEHLFSDETYLTTRQKRFTECIELENKKRRR